MERHSDHPRPEDVRAASPELLDVAMARGGQGTIWSLALEPTSKAPSVARRALRPLAPQIGRRMDDTALLLSELVTNAVIHGGARDGRSPVLVEFVLSPARLRVTVRDDGPGFDPGALRGSQPGLEGGRGLEILSMVAERVGIGGSEPFQVWFELDL